MWAPAMRAPIGWLFQRYQPCDLVILPWLGRRNMQPGSFVYGGNAGQTPNLLTCNMFDTDTGQRGQ